MEDKLDAVEVENVDWKNIVSDFYDTLKVELDIARKRKWAVSNSKTN